MQKAKMTSQASMGRKSTTNWISATGEEFSPATLPLAKLGGWWEKAKSQFRDLIEERGDKNGT